MGSFGNRVDKVFGSLGSSTSWRVSDQQLERREWSSCARERNASRDDLMPSFASSSSFDRRPRSRSSTPSFSDDRFDDDEDEDEDEGDDAAGPPFDRMEVEGHQHQPSRNTDCFAEAGAAEEDDDRQVRQMVGLDCTLDFEDEEDEFDRAAVGREGCSERLYMNDVKSTNRIVITSDTLSMSMYDMKRVPKDPRANHSAAKARLEEDAREAEDSCATSTTSHTSSNGQVHPYTTGDEQVLASDVRMSDEQVLASDGRMTEDDGTGSRRYCEDTKHEMSGMKRAVELTIDTAHVSSSVAGSKPKGKDKPVKRVRFALDAEQEMKAQERNVDSALATPRQRSPFASQVPDYVKNPSKYTHYTLDWSTEENELTNFEAFKACADILGHKMKEQEDMGDAGSLTRVQFIPRRKDVAANSSRDKAEAVPPLIGMAMSANDLESLSETLSTPIVVNEVEGALPACDTVLAGKLLKSPKTYRSKKGQTEGEGLLMEN